MQFVKALRDRIKRGENHLQRSQAESVDGE
jgi:hypothetical protein